MNTQFSRRRAGVLLHPTSLPDDGAAFVDAARRFVDWLAECGFTLWQMLPVHWADVQSSPYSSCSAFAGDLRLLRQAVPAALSRDDETQFDVFCNDAADWLDDYARFRVLKDLHAQRPWWEWPIAIRQRRPEALALLDRKHAQALAELRIGQFFFDRQWQAVRQHAHARGISLIGDLPFLVAEDSVETWCHPEYFELGDNGRPTRVAGVPPDYFSRTGQRWGNPLYCWPALAGDGFRWWKARLRHELRWFDILRLDHFRGLCAVWAIPAAAPTAEQGVWEPVPGAALLTELQATFGALPLIAEDLGYITRDVIALRDEFELPGLSILQFAFSGDAANPYLPHLHQQQSVVYTGTHDNDTACGWYLSLDDATRHQVDAYFGSSSEPMPWPLLRAALASVARFAVLPMQDVLGLDSRHRMNTPGTIEGNWQWRFEWDWIKPALSARLHELNRIYLRL